MGISNVAIKTFDSSGTQSLCRTNEYKGDEEVNSSFISKCNKLYISGSGETVIPGSLKSFPDETTGGGIDTFHINSDTDAISDITLNIEFKMKRPRGAFEVSGNWNANVCKDIILAMIDKVEIRTGSLIAQTLTADDIYIRNLTELGQPFTFSAPFESGEYTGTVGLFHPPLTDPNVWKRHATADGSVLVIQAACSIPFMGRSKDMSRSLLQAGALTNAVTVKVFYNNIYTSNSAPGDSHYQILSAGDSTILHDGIGGTSGDFLDTDYFKSFVTVKTHIISETEKNFISKNIIHKVLNTSANVTTDIPRETSVIMPTEGVTDIIVNLENVDFNVSHLLIGVRLPHVHNKVLSVIADGAPKDVDLDALCHNEMSTPFSVIDSQTFNVPSSASHYVSDNLFGYMPNAIESMELVIGSDRTGFIKGASAKIGGCENFTLVNSDKKSAHYIITLAEKAFDTSGISFSKCSNKKLLIKLNKFIFDKNDVTPNPLSSVNFSQNAVISVTACGTRVQSIVGGSMTFM